MTWGSQYWSKWEDDNIVNLYNSWYGHNIALHVHREESVFGVRKWYLVVPSVGRQAVFWWGQSVSNCFPWFIRNCGCICICRFSLARTISWSTPCYSSIFSCYMYWCKLRRYHHQCYPSLELLKEYSNKKRWLCSCLSLVIRGVE